MISAEGEKINFRPPVDANNKPLEFWMGDMERSMKASVHRELKKAFLEYPKTPRTRWCLEHPGQLVLTASQIYWTKEVEASF